MGRCPSFSLFLGDIFYTNIHAKILKYFKLKKYCAKQELKQGFLQEHKVLYYGASTQKIQKGLKNVY